MLTKEKKKQFKQKQPKAQHGAKGAEIRARIKTPGLERDKVKGKQLGFPSSIALSLPSWLRVRPTGAPGFPFSSCQLLTFSLVHCRGSLT